MMAEKVDFKIGKGMTIESLLEESGMNWFAEEQELITAGGIHVPKNKALVRSDNNHVLGVVGNRYEPVQNSTAFAFLDTLTKDEQATYQYFYNIDGGSKVIVQAKIDNGDFDVRRGDAIESYITMINSFNGTTPFKVFFTPIRLFCTNQLNAALKNATSNIVIRHTKTAEAKAEEAFAVLGKAKHYFDEFKKTAQALAQKTYDSKMVDMFLNEVMGEAESTRMTNQHEAVVDLAENGKGNNGESIWDLYNGYTEYVDHYASKDESKRLASAMVGVGFNKKAKAWDTAVSMLDS
jgi:phage/plasmid-like protein (TIGR03299 family)